MTGRSRRGASLPELIAVIAVTAILLAIAIPRLRHSAERGAVRGAVSDVVAQLSAARQLAVSRRGGVSVTIDRAGAAVHIVAGGDTLASRRLGQIYGVTVTSTRDSLGYDARGLGLGAANLTFVVVRGMTADTVVVSRLGRVRW
jgi:prepilin-type N-terminal cleavage/methylation domain-containing protein